jgi:hypothetical protein
LFLFIVSSLALLDFQSRADGVGHFFTSSANTFPPVPGLRLPGIPARGVGHNP